MFPTVGGLKLRIILSKINPDSALAETTREKLVRDIYKLMYPFFRDKTDLKKTAFTIQLIYREDLEIVKRKKGNKNYIGFFDFIHPAKIKSFYQLSIFQFQLLIKAALYYSLEKNNGFILHSSASLVNQKSYIFLGNSGAGKSTIIKLLREKYKALADDTSIIRLDHGKYFFYQTPFLEKEQWIIRGPEKYSVGKIFFIRKSDRLQVKKILNKNTVINKLLSHTILEKNEGNLIIKNVLEFIENFDEFYYLYFKNDSGELTKFIEKV